MRTVIQLASLLKADLHSRGLIREIADATGLERHTIAALLRNTAKYVSLDSISRLCDFLIDRRGVDPDILPAALFGKEQGGFWSMLASRKQVFFCLATRTNPDWSSNEYVMANDSHLLGILAEKVSALDTPTARQLDSRAQLGAPDNDSHDNDSHDNDSHDNDSHDNDSHDNDMPAAAATGTDAHTFGGGTAAVDAGNEDTNTKRVFADPRLVPAPRRVKNEASDTFMTLTEGQERAIEIYSQFQREKTSGVLFTLGSVKVNGVLEVLAGDIFKATPFQSQDGVSSAKRRACPFYFRYRSHDPAPESLCGGTRLSKREASLEPGIYYETEEGDWECCPCEPDVHDVAFILYAYRPPTDELQLACGGFSGVATHYLAKRFVSVASQIWAPQFRSPELEVGLFLVAFDVRKSTRGKSRSERNADFDHRVIRIHEDVLARRLGKPKKKRTAK